MMETEHADGTDEGDEPPEYRISHLQDDLADTFSERDAVGVIAPLGRGGIKARVKNRVTFSVSSETSGWGVTDVAHVLGSDGYAWTTDGPEQYVVLGREITDLRELRKGDRIHLNKRGGPFEVYRVLEQPNGPEVLQRSAPSVTVELSNVDTGTDWMVVRWKNESEPWAYCKTKDKHAKGGFRYRKVERVERSGRVGPRRLFAPDPERVEQGYQETIHERVQFAADNGWLGDVHRSDVDRVLDLMSKPAAELFAPEDADTIREVLDAASDAYERQGNAMAMEAGEDEEMKALAADNQMWGRDLETLASAFNLLGMDPLDESESVDIYRHSECGQAFTSRFKYSKHCGLCDADEESGDDQTDADADPN